MGGGGFVSKVRRYEVTAAGDFASVLDVLTDHLGLHLVSLDEVERWWIDTADGALATAGTTLELRRPRGGGNASLVWSGPGRVLASDPCVPSAVPERAADLPTSAAFARAATVIGDARLVADPPTDSDIAALACLDDEEKTTVRVVLDRSTTADGVALPMILEVVALRGYESDAAKLDEALHRRVALSRTPSSMKERVTRGVAATEPMASMSAAMAWRSAMQQLTDAMTRTFPGVLRGDDPEDLHAFRVAIRRIRTLLQDGAEIFDPERRDRFRRDFRWLGDITTPTRDADVHLIELPTLLASVPSELRPQAERFESVLSGHRTTCHAEMVVELRSMRRAEFGTAWAEFLADDDAWIGHGAPADDPATTVVAARVARAHRQLIKSGRRIRKDSPPIALHELRKEAKRLRYLLECFGRLFDADVADRIVQPLRGLQDVLGEFQDTEVQANALHSLVGEPSPALDAVIGRLRERGDEARRAFPAAFGRFDDRKVTRALLRLETAKKNKKMNTKMKKKKK